MTRHVAEEGIPAASALEILARCGTLVQPAVKVAIDRLHPRLRRMAGFSFGWYNLDGTRKDGIDISGKGIRQALAVLSAEAAGGSAEATMPGAVAVELVHAFSLVHDDIMDGDEKRRHRVTLWKAYGIGPAVLTGDALLALAVETIASIRSEHAPVAMRHLATAITDLAYGQAQDIDFETRPWTGADAVGVDEYRMMVDQKTGSLLSCATAIGAVLAGAPAPVICALTLAGRHLGRVFQAVDDLLGIWGDPSLTGKPVFNDLRRGKKTLPVLAAIGSDTSSGRRLGELLSRRNGLDDHLLPLVVNLIEKAGGCCLARQESQRNLTCALRVLDAAPISDSAAEELAVVARFLDGRSR
ncbi:MAG TPA: polyprenyl synthetase family protein [Mycobacteriales bacterium]|jgi:geranylgeranyl diphosphate synthase type I|nr:polyprenyl synthetase family protein [Mycobacteriales bacterium]